jgi:hypothetical protein
MGKHEGKRAPGGARLVEGRIILKWVFKELFGRASNRHLAEDRVK